MNQLIWFKSFRHYKTGKIVKLNRPYCIKRKKKDRKK